MPRHNPSTRKFTMRPPAMEAKPPKKPAPVGERFGRLVVVAEGPPAAPTWPKGQRPRTWVCRCECGTLVTPLMANIKAGRTKSCGCQEMYRNDDVKRAFAERTRRMWAEQRALLAQQ